jgi:uncharacterized membrane-anchored protein
MGEYIVQYERQLRNAKKEQETINELLTRGLIRKMLEREARGEREARVCEAPAISYTYTPSYEYIVQYERQIRNAKKEQETINELLTLGLIRKMLEREASEANE